MRARVLFALPLLSCSVLLGQSQYALITASNIGDLAGNKLASGTITFTPVLTPGSTLPASPHLTGGGRGLATPITFNVTEGVLSPIYGTAQLVDVTQANPANFCYADSVHDNNTGETWTPDACVQPAYNADWCIVSSGQTICDFDDYVPPGTPGVLQTTGPTGPAGPPGPTGPQGAPSLLGQGQGAWSSGTTYAVGVVVTYSGQSYASLVSGNIGHQPDTSPTQWALLVNLSNLPVALASQSAAAPQPATFTAVNFTDGTAQTTAGVSIAALTGTNGSLRPSFALYPHSLGFFAGSANGSPPGTTNWTNDQGQLNVTGSAGSGTLTLNSMTVTGSGGINDYCGTTPGTTVVSWAALIHFADGTFQPVTVGTCTSSVVSIYPTLRESVTGGALYNLYDGPGGQHLSPQGYADFAAWLVSLKKYQGYIQQAALYRLSDASGTFSGTAMTPLGGLTNGGYVPGTTIYQLYQEALLNSSCGGTTCGSVLGEDPSTDANKSWVWGERYATVVGAGSAGMGVQLAGSSTALGGQSGYFHAFVSVVGQHSSTPASELTVKVTVDGVTLYSSTTVAGLTEVTVPFTNGWNGVFQVYLTSSAPTVFIVSSPAFYTWPPALNAEMQEPIIPPSANVVTMMDSWGALHSAAFPTALQSLLAANPKGASTEFTNYSLGGQTAIWGITNFPAQVAPKHPDYVVSDFQINDYASASGIITGYTITAGGIYSSTPTVTISGCSGTPATATAVLTGTAVSGLVLTQVGTGCTSPTVAFSPSGATATLTVTPETAAQVVSNINALANLELANGTTPIYLRSLSTTVYSQSAVLDELGEQFNTLTTAAPQPAAPSGSGGSAFTGGLGASYQDATEISAPANPASGNDRLYVSASTHQLQCLTSGGGSCMPSGGSGNTIWNGTGAPTSGIGSNGDFYIDTAATCIYGPKASGAWPGSCTALIGATGSTGATGSAGPNSVSTSTTTTITGLLKGASGNIAQAVSGTDYAPPNANTTGSAGSFTGSLAGDVTGTQGATSVVKVNGASVPTSKAIVGTNSSGQFIDATTTTLPTAMEPAHTGDVTNTAGSLATSVVKVNGASVPASKAIVGTNSSGQFIDATTTTLPTAMEPAHTGDMTNTAGSLATTVAKVNGNTPGVSCTNQVVTAIDSSARGTCSSVVGSQMASNTVTAAQLAAQYSKGSCTEAWVGSGTSSALQSGDDAVSNNTCFNDSGVTRTITAVKCRSSIASNTTTVNPTFGSAGTGTTILSGALTCGSSYAYSSTGTVSNASWTTGSGIDPAMGGTLTGTSIAVIVEYTY